MNPSRTLRLLLFAGLLFGIMLAAADFFVSRLSVVLLTFAGVLFGIFLNGLGRLLSRWAPISYRWSYLIVVVGMIGLLIGGF